VIPVGPNKVYRKYLQECLDSIKEQIVPPDEVILIDDMADILSWGLDYSGLPVRLYENAWLCGCAHSFNFGVASADNELVIMLGSDDKLYPWAVKDALAAWERYKDPLGYYFFEIEYSDTGETQAAANNCAMVTKSLWKHTGGFPIGSDTGPCDHIFLSIMLAHKIGNIYRIESEKPAYWYRRHQDSLTNHCIPNAAWYVEQYYNEFYKLPEWGRYE